MQTDLEAQAPGAAAILGVNLAGLESDNGLIIDGRDLPWLQDTEQADVWDAWGANWRDVVILDGDNHRVAVYNLTDHDLADAANYDALEQMILDAR